MGLYFTRQPLINRQGKIIATRLRLHASNGENIGFVAEALNALTESWPPGERGVFVNFGSQSLDSRLLDWIAPANATIELAGAALTAESGPALLGALKESGTSLCYDFDDQAARVLAGDAAFRFIGFDAAAFSAAQLKTLFAKTQSFGIPVAFNVETQESFRAVIDAGAAGAAGWFVKQPASVPAKQLNASQAHIVRVLNLVRKNADVAQIELR